MPHRSHIENASYMHGYMEYEQNLEFSTELSCLHEIVVSLHLFYWVRNTGILQLSSMEILKPCFLDAQLMVHLSAFRPEVKTLL